MKRLTVTLLAAFILSLCASSFAEAADFNLVIPLPLTGKQAKFGEMMKRSYEIAAEEINAKGGIRRAS